MNKIFKFSILIWLPLFATAQKDTLTIISPKHIPVNEFQSRYFYSKKNIIYISLNSRKIDSDSDTFIRNMLNRGHYCIFFDKEHKKIEEGYWDIENFEGPYIGYYKNGQIMVKGSYYGNQKIGEWIYYKEDGSIEKKENNSR